MKSDVTSTEQRVMTTGLPHHHHHHHQQRWQPQHRHLSQQEDPLAIRPDDMVHVRPHTLPPQLCSPQARLSLTHTHTHVRACIGNYTTQMSTHSSSYQVYLGVGVAHVADYAAVLHLVQMFPHHHIFVAFE